MKKKEIVELDCGVEVRKENVGILFSCMDDRREFAFGLKNEEVPDMITYLQTHLLSISTPGALKPIPMPNYDGDHVGMREMTPVEKAAVTGVTGVVLGSPGMPMKNGRVIPVHAVSIHKS